MLALPLAVAAALAAAPAAPPAIPPLPQLRTEITAADARLFDLFFNRCDPAAMRSVVAGDVEFYHDKAGVVARSAEQLVADYAKTCTERSKPGAWRSRRQLVIDSLTVDPVPGHGAIATGEHLFYERKGDGAEHLAGRARFAIVWKREADGWKLSRALSFAHAAAE